MDKEEEGGRGVTEEEERAEEGGLGRMGSPGRVLGKERSKGIVLE